MGNNITSEDIVYVAGPMRGYEFLNLPKFHKMAKHLQKKYGCTVLNPASTPGGLTDEQYIKIDIEFVFASTAIMLLKGHENSLGANVEYALARYRGIKILHEADEKDFNILED